MNLKLIVIIVVSFLSLISLNSVYCSDNNYNVDKIPAGLRNNGGAVIRNKEEVFRVEDASEATYEMKYAVTIFNKEEQHFGTLKLTYDSFRTIEELEGTIYNSEGEVIRELDNSDIKDYSAFDGISIYTDSRIKIIELYYNDFPYTVEFKYEYSFDGFLNWPTWYSRNYVDAVEYSSFKVITPLKYDLRYWCNFEDVQPIKNEVDDEMEYLWQAKNLPKLSYDAVGEDIEDIATIVQIAPLDFEIDGYEGNMKSWKDFGLWFYELYKDKDGLPEAAKNEIEDKANSVNGTKNKIDILYKYMQSKTHYISVQLGIGGWQPFDATYVYTNGFGDCKALSNFMVSILKIAGISAYPVLIKSGQHRLPLVTEFPSNQFNHAIVCVPQESDTIWLECTSQIMPTGKIGPNNENREALMITPEGGIIVKTPPSNAENNSQTKKMNVKLSTSGNAVVSSNMQLCGDQFLGIVRNVSQKNSEQKNRWLKDLFEVPGMEIKNYNFEVAEDSDSVIQLNMEVEVNKYAAISGNRIFFNPNLIERRTYVPITIEKRLSPIRFSYPYFDSDTIFYEFPKSYQIEALPNEINLQTSFGTFTSKTLSISDNQLLYIRGLRIDTYTIPAENYEEYRNFFAEVVKADKQQVVLVKSR